jgi:uncharacterized protein YjbJ (UPF0337 family)
MNIDELKGTGNDVKGQVKEAFGNATGDHETKAAGVADQVTGSVQKTVGAAKEAVADNVAPLADQARGFAKKRPFATAALLGVVGLALINTLRGKSAA